MNIENLSSKEFYTIIGLLSLCLTTLLYIFFDAKFFIYLAALVYIALVLYHRAFMPTYVFAAICFFPLTYLLLRGFGIEDSYSFSNGLVGFEVPDSVLMLYLVGLLFFAAAFFFISNDKPPISIDRPPSKIYGVILWLGYIIGVAAGLGLYLNAGVIPLLNIGERWSLDPKLMILLASHIVVLPALLCYYQHRSRPILLGLVILVSFILMIGLGTRNLPIKMCLSIFLTLVLISPRAISITLSISAVFSVTVMIVVGALTKGSIYAAEGFLKIPLTLIYTDTAGTLYNFSSIVSKSNALTGFYGDARMYIGSVLSMIPGTDGIYANYYVTEIVNGTMSVTRSVNGEAFTSLMSLSPGMFGVGYGSFGVTGLIFEATALGMISGAAFKLGKREPILAFFGGSICALVAYSAYAGYLGADTLLVFAFFAITITGLPIVRKILYR